MQKQFIKFVLVCLICAGIITGMVFLINLFI